MSLRSPKKGTAGVLGDWLLAAILAGSAQYEVWTADGSVGQRIGGALCLLVATVPLAWRRRAPLHVAVAVSAALLAGGLLFPDHQASFQGFLASIVALYSVSAYAEGNDRILGAAAVAASLAGYQLADVLRGNDIGEMPGIWLPYLVAFALGRARGWQLGESRQLRHRAAELERERDEKARLAVAEERARIARELHDIVAHSLSIVVVQTAAVRRRLREERPREAETLDGVEATARQALQEMRRLLGILRTEEDSPALAPQPGMAEVDRLVTQMRAAGLDVDLCVNGNPRPIPPGVDLVAYRIVQESLVNVLKHAGAVQASVVASYDDSSLALAITNTGLRAGDAATASASAGGPGHGLIGMRERVALYGGSFESGRAGDGGFTVRARLPLGGT